MVETAAAAAATTTAVSPTLLSAVFDVRHLSPAAAVFMCVELRWDSHWPSTEAAAAATAAALTNLSVVVVFAVVLLEVSRALPL